MQCPSGHRVPGGSRFCPVCGVPLGSEVCPSCSAPLTAGARFCAACGAPAPGTTPKRRRDDASAAADELRQITAVFCDMVGSTELSARLDAEEFGEITQAYQERVGAVLESYGGAVHQYQGDGVLIHFGWPRAHGDDAERAVLASLAIVDALATAELAHPVAVRIGIHTGPVLVGEMGSGSRRAPMALGETMNRAARLQGCAEPGGVVISETTLQLVRGIFLVEDLGPQELKGIDDPTSAYRVLQRSGVRSKLDAAGDRLTPFVSRNAELALLKERWELARSGSGQAMLITGEPGIGKSRLVHELRQGLSGSGHTWLEARGSSYTQHTAFAPVIELMEQALEIDAEMAEAERLRRLEDGLRAVDVEDSDALSVFALLLDIDAEGVPQVVMSPGLTRRRTTELLAKWVLALARWQPLILLAEDLHWCDSASLELFEQLLVQGGEATVMLIATSRPGLEAAWLEHPQLTKIGLSPLAEAETRALLTELAAGKPLPEQVVRRVIDETDGVPLFAEEVGRMVLESGMPAAELEIPATLQDSLMARLDRLSAAKRVAQLASVIGREFDYHLLEEVSGLDADLLTHGLGRLVEDDLLYADGDPPEASYNFKHALIQDAAYRSLPRRARRDLHRATAEALDGRAGASPELLARHWEAAGNAREAIGAYGRAAEDSARHSAMREATEHLSRAIGLLSEVEDEAERTSMEIDLQSALGASTMALHGYADPAIEAAYDRARDLCGRIERGSRVGYTLVGLAIYYFNSGQLTEGAKLAEEALEIAAGESDDSLELLGHVQLAIPRLWQARFAESRDHAEAACALYDRERHADLGFRFGTDQGVAARCFAAFAHTHTGDPERGLARANEGVALARELGKPFDVAYALTLQSCLSWVLGDLDSQRRLAEEAVAISQDHGFADFQGMGRLLDGVARALDGPDRSGLDDCVAGLELAAGTGRRGGATGFLEGVALAHRAHGESEAAENWVSAGLALGEETGERWCEPRLLRVRAELRFARDGDTEAAARELRRGVERAREAGDPLSELDCANGLARLPGTADDPAAVAALLRGPYSALSGGPATRAAREAAELLGDGATEPFQPGLANSI